MTQGTDPAAALWAPTVDDEDKEEKFVKLWGLIMDDPDYPEYSETFWQTLKADDPDSLVLRFMRARKWDPVAAHTMISRCIRWRKEFGVADIQEAELPRDQFDSNKFYFYQHCREGRPIGWIHVQLHEKDVCPFDDLKKWCVYQMETGRELLQFPNEKITLVFDMTNFGMKNMDFNFVHFLAQCFEAYYPESLGLALIVNAPWIFTGCWKIISPLLDPVVKNKIQFVSSSKMGQHIDETYLPKVLGGSRESVVAYVPPGGWSPKTDDEEYKKLLEERVQLQKEIGENTRWIIDNWTRDAGKRDEIRQKFKERQDMKKKLSENHFELNRFREPHQFFRNGILKDHGRTVSFESPILAKQQ